MNKPLDREAIARAMREAAQVAKNGTREERSGRFLQGSMATSVKVKPKESGAKSGAKSVNTHHFR